MELLEDLVIQTDKDVNIRGIRSYKQELREFQQPEEVFQVRFDEQSEQLGSCYLNGDIRLHSINTNT